MKLYMKGIKSLLAFAVLYSVFLTNVPSMHAASTGLSWSSDIITVHQPASGGVWYPRLLKLNAEQWLLSFDTNEGGGNTKIVVMRTNDGGATWSTPSTVASYTTGNVANGQMLQLPTGEIWLAYRMVIQSGTTYHTSLNVKQSHDLGLTWSDLPGGLIAETSATGFKGLWEPHLEIVNGSIAVLYADDSPAAAGSTGLQNLYMKTWNGTSWGSRITVSDGVAAGSRDGMPVITRLQDGRYMTVFEASDVPGHPFVIKYKISADGLDWSGPRQHLYTPNGTGKKAGAPYVVTLTDGRIVVAFQTDENSSNTGDPYTSMHTLISDNGGSSWEHKHNTFPVSSTTSSNWNAMMVVDPTHIVAVTSSDYPTNGIYLRHGYTITPAGVNLINNGSFENGYISGWTTYGTDYPDRIHIHGINDGIGVPAAHGSYFVGLSGTSSPATAYIGQTITGLDDGSYTLTAQMRSSGGQSSCLMEIKDYGGITRTIACPVTNGWTTVTIPDVNVNNGTATIGFYTANSSSSQWADIDHIQFTRQAYSIANGKNYRLIFAESDKTLEIDGWGVGDGDQAAIWRDHGGANQQWSIHHVTGSYYKLINVNSNKALEVDAWSTSDGAKVQQWADNSTPNQLWSLSHIGNGRYKLINVHSGKALDVANGLAIDGTKVQQWSEHNSHSQRWTLIQYNQ